MRGGLHIANKKKAPRTQAICLVPLLIFFTIDIVLTLIFGSFEANPTQTQDFDTKEEDRSRKIWESPEPTWSVTCDRAHFEYDICYINHPLTLDPTTVTLSSQDPTNTTPPLVEKIRPYPRKFQHNAMGSVKEVTLTTTSLYSPCTVTHASPALVFSAGGFTSNIFHDFNEGFVPLFVTVDSFFVNQDVVLVITDCQDWWLDKYEKLLPHFTRHPIVNLDEETATHCFPSAIVGLMSHGAMLTILDFRALLASAYGGDGHIHSPPRPPTRPRLVLITRSHNRVLVNQDEVVQAAKDIGFDVVEIEPTRETPVGEMFRILDSSHAMVGVHGAGMTNELFLRQGAVVMQIVPVKNSWLADICYGKLAVRLGLEYIVYDVAIEESSLAENYPRDMLSAGGEKLMRDWSNWDIYMHQNVSINLARFRRHLEKAYEKAKLFMQQET
ncbi:Protein O-GlcNAc transferase [Bertholletia excelsa]